MLKSLPYIVFFLLLISAVFFVLTRSGQETNNGSVGGKTATSETKGNNNLKTYSQAPATLAAGDLVGKKARFETSKGTFTIELFGDKTPKTVSNFVTLAKDGFYNGLIFHRVIPGFMIQGGDPEGNGTGGPGYQFEDEFDSSLNFSKAGMLAMANSGPNTNGSQFFISVAPTEWLNGKHTIFGQVTEGMDVVMQISQVKTATADKPVDQITINKIEII